MSHGLNEIHKSGGKAILLTEYEEKKEDSVNELLEKVENSNWCNNWEQ